MVTDHAVLFKFKDSFTDEQEINMYEGLWSFKDYFPTIIAMSLGRVLCKNAEDVTHVLMMRFPSGEAIDLYLADEYFKKVVYSTIVPFFNGELVADYDTEVDSDPTELCRLGEKYETGVEDVQLFKVKEDAPAAEVEDFLNALNELPQKVGINIVQLTAGTNLKTSQKYSHAVNIRLASVEDLGLLVEDPAYLDLLEKFAPILDGTLRVDFLVDESKKAIIGGVSSMVGLVL